MVEPNEMDALIEDEVCNRLIRLSCAKMVNSKNERGGAKLHRNLLILHLLRKARDEQRRSPPCVYEMTDESLRLKSVVNRHPAISYPMANIESGVDNVGFEGEEDDDDDDLIDDDEDESEGGCSRLYDLSKSTDCIQYRTDLESSGSVEFDYTSLRLNPIQYPIGDTGLYSEVEMQTKSNFDMYTVPMFSSDYFPNVVATNSSHLEYSAPECSYSTPPDDQVSPSIAAIDADDEQVPDKDDGGVQETSSSSEEDDESVLQGRKRKRKRSTTHLRLSTPCSAKKCCVEMSGLISVFSSGLNVVADQFLTSSANTDLHSDPQQLGPFMQIACNPLIC